MEIPTGVRTRTVVCNSTHPQLTSVLLNILAQEEDTYGKPRESEQYS